MGRFYKDLPVLKQITPSLSSDIKPDDETTGFQFEIDYTQQNVTPEKPIYLLIKKKLRNLAIAACNAVSKYYNDCSDLLLGSQIVVKCSKKISATNNAKLFHELRRDRSNTTTTSDNGWNYLIEPDGISINITLPEYLCFDHDIQDIANEIIRHTKDACIPIDRRLNRLVKQYLKVKGTEYVSFSNNYPPLGDVNVDRLATACVNVRAKVYNFLIAFQRSCSPRMHRVDNAQDKIKTLRIFIDKALNVFCNKKKINLIKARKASLFALALCDVKNLSPSDYYIKRRPYLKTTDPSLDNYANSFAQNIDTIKKQFNEVEAIVIEGGCRKITGIIFRNPIPKKEIKSWLKKTIHKPRNRNT